MLRRVRGNFHDGQRELVTDGQEPEGRGGDHAGPWSDRGRETSKCEEGKDAGDRHPKVRRGAMIGAGAKILYTILRHSTQR